MDVLTKNVPTLDPADVPGSFRQIYDYLFNTMEQIDYTLSRQGVQLGKVNLPATSVQIKQLAGEVNALSSGVAILNGTVSVLASRMDGAEDTAAKLNTKVDGLIVRLSELETQAAAQGQEIERLNTRVAALEGAQTS